MNDPREISAKILDGDVRLAARLMRGVDDGMEWAIDALKLLYPRTGGAYVLGITGSPGVGKSTLTDALVECFRGQGQTVGVVAIDPTSPFTGGALLGDRIRMQRHAADEEVFIRSLATRGQFGGLTASTRGVVTVLDAMGKDVIIVETVGVGQDEVDIASMADTTVIVTVPGLGDDIQAIKAGILEVADLFVVNKSDRQGAQATARQLEAMLEQARGLGRYGDWVPSVLLTCAADGVGMEELIRMLEDHREALLAQGAKLLGQGRRESSRRELWDLLQRGAMEHFMARLGQASRLDDLVGQIADKKKDPYSVSQDLLRELLKDWAGE